MAGVFNSDGVILSLKQKPVLLKEDDWTLLGKFLWDSLLLQECFML